MKNSESCPAAQQVFYKTICVCAGMLKRVIKLIKSVKTGDRAEIGFKGSDGDRRRLATIVEAVIGKEVLILMPMSVGAMVKLPINSGFEARFYTGTSVIVYDVTILEHPIIDGIYLTRLRLDSAGEKIQLRDFYRMNSAIEFSFSLAKEQLDGNDDLKLYKALTKDLSGGGMSFVTDLEMEDKTEIYANFVLDGEYIVVLGRAMGKQKAENAAYAYLYRCQFLAMPDLEQEKIVQFINNQQFKTLSQKAQPKREKT